MPQDLLRADAHLLAFDHAQHLATDHQGVIIGGTVLGRILLYRTTFIGGEGVGRIKLDDLPTFVRELLVYMQFSGDVLRIRCGCLEHRFRTHEEDL